jgi:hypothetical protein
MVICGFVLAIVFFLLWPHEPSPFIAPTMLAATALIYAAVRYIGSQSLRRVIRAARNYSTAALSRRVGIVNLQLKRGR